ncbi:MAG: nitroreductase [Alphaproteobacteria bacterium]|nr:nitroreductase [Alphaproteobacteria bacterium]
MDVIEAILTRRSIRAFLPTPVPKETVAEILDLAARAPSGTNMQPWKVYAVAGAAKEKLTKETLAAIATEAEAHVPEYKYYPDEWVEPYKSRRQKVGLDLYSLLGLTRENKEGMRRQQGRNYEFFGAPVGLFFTIDKHLEVGSWLDYGMFVENVMLIARAKGLHSCPQASWPPFHRILRKHLPIPEEEMVVCGMSLGYIDEAAPENHLETERAPASEFAFFRGF